MPLRALSKVMGSFLWLTPVFIGLMSPGAVAQSFQNGGFESGDLSGCWNISGSVEVLQAGNFGPAIAPSEGSFFALISTGPDATGADLGDFDGNGISEFEIVTLAVTFSVINAPTTLCFDWMFLTDEFDQPANFDDFFQVTLNGTSLLAQSSLKMAANVSTFPDSAPYDGIRYQVTSGGAADGSDFEDGRTNFSTFCTPINTAGTYTLQFLVADQADGDFDSGLLVDNITVDADCGDLTITQITDSSGSQIELKNGGLVFTRQENGQVAASGTGNVAAFVSNGDFSGDNPNVIDQIFAVSGGVFERITAATGEHVGRPALSRNGRWLTFEYAGNPLGTNADGNVEIFRYDRTNDVFLQVTDTVGCVNSHPGVSHDGQGRRLTFASDCNEMTPGDGFNPDGNREIVLYDANSANYLFNGSSGCDNRDPVISRHNGGRFISFISDCDYTGGNGDGNLEVFQWNRQSGNIVQISNTSLAAGEINDSVSTNFNGLFVSFISNADLVGQNAANNTVAYRYRRNNGNLIQLTPSDPTLVYLSAQLDDSGNHVALERVNFASFEIEILHLIVGGATTALVSGDNSFPAMSLNGAIPRIFFQSGGNFTGNNGDGNVEIWLAEVN